MHLNITQAKSPRRIASIPTSLGQKLSNGEGTTMSWSSRSRKKLRPFSTKLSTDAPAQYLCTRARSGSPGPPSFVSWWPRSSRWGGFRGNPVTEGETPEDVVLYIQGRGRGIEREFAANGRFEKGRHLLFTAPALRQFAAQIGSAELSSYVAIVTGCSESESADLCGFLPGNGRDGDLGEGGGPSFA